jgi:hypothetical protein
MSSNRNSMNNMADLIERRRRLRLVRSGAGRGGAGHIGEGYHGPSVT